MNILTYMNMNRYDNRVSLEVAFQALSAPVRIEIMRLLGSGPCCVNIIANSLGISQCVVSQHLRVMRLAGIVIAEKRGKHVHYSIREDTIDALREFLKTVCGCCNGKHNGNHARHECEVPDDSIGS